MESVPIPARLVQPWIEDNEKFVREELADRRSSLENVSALRDKIDLGIRVTTSADRVAIDAIDAAVVDVAIGDMTTILIQSVKVSDKGEYQLGPPKRATGIGGHEIELAKVPMRIVEEFTLLSKSESTTIADTSYWSMLMEVNQAITRQANSTDPNLLAAIEELVDNRLFLKVLRNPNVIAMTKKSQAVNLSGSDVVSDREAFGQILREDEFTSPRSLKDRWLKSDGDRGTSFGIEKRRFMASERDEIKHVYENELGVIFFKPHVWTRAFRIEGKMSKLNDDNWLMPVLAGIKHHTTTRTFVEPFPQAMADFTAKQLAGVSKLYGSMNYHRAPFFDPSRTFTGIRGNG